MRDLQHGDYVLDTDGAHWVDVASVPQDEDYWQPFNVDASAVADAGHGAPHGPRNASETTAEAAYDQSPYPAPASYVTLTDVPWGRRKA